MSRHLHVMASVIVLAGCAAVDPSAGVSLAALDESCALEGTCDGGAGEISPDGDGTGAWLASPIASPRITSPVSHRSGSGWRRADCSAISRANHRGTDFGVARGSEVRAAAAGTVIRMQDGCSNSGSLSSTCGGGYGNHVIIAHPNGYATLYAHLTPRSGLPAVGTRVGCGDRIGLSGNSGRSTGPHLHFEVRRATSVGTYFVSGNTIDPYGGSCSSQPGSLWIGGSPTSSCAGTGPRDDAQVVRATYPREIAGRAGQRITQTFSVRNTGTTTWEPSTHVWRHQSGAYGEVAEVRLPSSVAPGASIDLEVVATVPAGTGAHRGTWRMTRADSSAFGQEGSLAVRVPAAPRACRSATLGRDVADGGCVQVTYAGCGMSTCAWYRCDDGGWTCADTTTCEGDTHPNAACAPPEPEMPMPTECLAETESCASDASCCDGLACVAGRCTDASACELEGNACGSDAECCPLLSCRRPAIGSSERLCCASGGAHCDGDDDCCGEMACSAGRCMCRERGQSCAQSLDCCGAMICIDGTCGS